MVFFLAGPNSEAFCATNDTNRAAHFAGGRVEARLAELGENYSVSLWFWNGMPSDARETAGWLFSRDRNHSVLTAGDHLGLGGTASEPGKLILQHGEGKPVVGRTAIDRWTWAQAVMVREGQRVRVYLNGSASPEIDIEAPADFPDGFGQLFLGGRSDNDSNWEGRLDEIAIFDRALTPQEIEKLAGQ